MILTFLTNWWINRYGKRSREREPVGCKKHEIMESKLANATCWQMVKIPPSWKWMSCLNVGQNVVKCIANRTNMLVEMLPNKRLVIPRSRKTYSQTIATFKPLSSLSSFTFILSPRTFIPTRLSVILKSSICTVMVLIMKQFDWQAGKAQFFDCTKSVHAHHLCKCNLY